jgi:hypothetical protein
MLSSAQLSTLQLSYTSSSSRLLKFCFKHVT